jgi:hypothetical protein
LGKSLAHLLLTNPQDLPLVRERLADRSEEDALKRTL